MSDTPRLRPLEVLPAADDDIHVVDNDLLGSGRNRHIVCRQTLA